MIQNLWVSQSVPGFDQYQTFQDKLAKRLGLTEQTDPDRIETDLNALVPKKERAAFSFRMADHGRAICTARKPGCGECPLSKLCLSAFKA